MDSTAFLRRSFSPAPPLPTCSSWVAGRLPFISFHRNVCSIQLLAENSNENDNNKHGRDNNNNNNNGGRIAIRCTRITKDSSSFQGGGFPPLNPKRALQSLFCFSLNSAPTEHIASLNAGKKKALQTLLDQNPVEAEKIMRNVYEKYQNDSSGVIRYDATLAFVEFLIHLGTDHSLNQAIRHLTKLEEMPEKPSDAKRSLYRAVAYTLKDEVERARTAWKKYTGSIETGPNRLDWA